MIKLQLASFLARLSKREKLAFYLTVGVVAVVLLDRLVLWPILYKMDQLDRDIRLEEEAIKNSLSILTQEKKITDERDKYTPYLSEQESEEKEKISFSKEIEDLAKKSSVYLIGIRPTGEKDEDVAKRYFLDIELEAQMEQIFALFYAIESSGRLFKIEKYYIRPKAAESSIATCTMSVSKVVLPK